MRAAALLGLIRRLRALLGRGVRIALLLRGCGRGEHAALLLRGLLARILLRGTRIGALLRCARLLLLNLPAQVTTGSIQAAVSGSGTLTSEDVEDLSVPATVKVEKLYVEQGDTVEVGEVVGVVSCSTSMVGVGMGWKGT